MGLPMIRQIAQSYISSQDDELDPGWQRMADILDITRGKTPWITTTPTGTGWWWVHYHKWGDADEVIIRVAEDSAGGLFIDWIGPGLCDEESPFAWEHITHCLGPLPVQKPPK